MSTINDGGPAFPQPPCPDCGTRHAPEHVPGMSLRDYFAAKAMQAYVAANGPASDEDGDFVGQYAYEIADAMLKAREVKA